MEPEKEKWIHDVLSSLDGIQRAEPNPFLFAKIKSRLHTARALEYIPARIVWVTGLSFALLLWINWRVLVLNQSSLSDADQPTDLNAVITDMHLYPTQNQPYSLWSEQNY